MPRPRQPGRLGHSVAMLLKRYANCIEGQELAANERIAGRWRMTVYEKLGADVRPLKQGLTPRLRTSQGPASTVRAMFRA